MKLKLSVFLSVFLFTAPAFAQGDIFAGYAFGSIDFGFDIRETSNGLAVAGHKAFSENVGIEGDFSGAWGSFGPISFNVQTFTVGPRFTGGGDTKAYFHALFGGARSSILGFSSTDFAMIVGGGVDVPMNERTAFRFGADYVPVFSTGSTTNNIRVVAGIVFRFGE